MDANGRAAGRYGLVLCAILATLVIAAAAESTTLGWVLTVASVSGTLLLSLKASGVSTRAMTVALVAVAVCAVVASFGVVAAPHSFGRAATEAVFSILILVPPIAIIRRLATDRLITFETALGALCVYLMLGFFFSSIFALIGTVDPSPFFAQKGAAGTLDYLYFSYVTLTTVGYGDLTAAGNVGRMLAVTEALMGQLYLVSVVALVVGNIGHVRARGGGDTSRPSEDDDTDGPAR